MRQNLKKARAAAGLTQQQVADKLGIGLAYYQKIEAGERDGHYALWDAMEDLLGIHQRILREDVIRCSAQCQQAQANSQWKPQGCGKS